MSGWRRWWRIRRLHDGLAGVAAAVAGLIAATSVDLGWATLQRSPSMPAAVAIFAVALAVAWAWKSRYAVPAVLAVAAVVGWGVMR